MMMFLVLFGLMGLLFSSTAEGCGAGRQMLKSGGLSAYEKQAIVDAHNRLRQSVALGQVSKQPPAANMMEMVWDEELAARSQYWADQCTPAHDRASQRDVQRFPVGQNIAATWTTRPPSGPEDSTPDFAKQINAWFDEVRIYGFQPINGGHGTGHYSQLVWGETNLVGCGYTFYYDNVRGYTKLYVCNYGPGGNVIGSNPYEKGYPSCTAYGLSESQKYNGLCSSYTSSTSYQTVQNSDNNIISNVIPDSGNNGYKTYDYQFSNQFSNQYNNQYQYQFQNSYNQQPAETGYQTRPQIQTLYQPQTQTQTLYQPQQQAQTVYNYPSQSINEPQIKTITYESPSHSQPTTYRPFISIFKTATDLFTKPKSSGFRFGTLYL